MAKKDKRTRCSIPEMRCMISDYLVLTWTFYVMIYFYLLEHNVYIIWWYTFFRVHEIAYWFSGSKKKICKFLINFLLQNINIVSVLSKIWPDVAGHIWQDWTISRILTFWLFFMDQYIKAADEIWYLLYLMY